MNRRPIFVATIVFAAVTGAHAGAGKPKDAPVPAATEQKGDAKADRAETERRLNDEIAGVKREMARLGDEIKQAGGKAKAETKKAFDELKTELGKLEKNFEHFRASAGAEWDHGKKEIQSTVDGFEKSIADFAAKIRSK